MPELEAECGAIRPTPQPIRVAIDATLAGTQNTGDSAYWRGLIYGLATLPTSAEFLLITNGPADLPADLPSNMLTLALPKASPRWYSLWNFPRAARHYGADVIHTQYNLSPFVRDIGVTTIHDVSFFIEPRWFKVRDRLLLKWGIPSSIRRAAAVLTVSETSKSEIIEFVPEASEKVVVTPNALDPNFVVPKLDDAQQSVAELYGLRNPYVLTIGSIWPRKNVALAAEAVKLAGDGLEIAIVGQYHAGEMPDHPCVRALGYVPDHHLGALYRAAIATVIPSFHEGFGIPVLESWASSTPVICSAGGALPEIAGDAAMIVDSWDPAPWADAINQLRNDSSKVALLRTRGRQRLKQFSWKETAWRTLAVYFEVAQQ